MGNAIALWEKSLQKYMMAEDNSLAAEKQQMSVKENLIEAVDAAANKDQSFLKKMLNKTFRIRIADGRTLIGVFLCTDKDQNIILGQCQEFVKSNGLEIGEEARMLGLAMIPGRHIVSIEIDTHIAEFGTGEQSRNCFKLENST